MTGAGKLEDDTPTTTINFDSVKEVDHRIDAKNFNAIPMPEDGGVIIIHLLQWIEVIKIKFQIKDDSTFPSSGDSAADKWADLKTLIKSGGDNAGLLELTFDSEDSKVGTPQTETYVGRAKLLHKRSVAGEHLIKIDGDFEFWVGDV